MCFQQRRLSAVAFEMIHKWFSVFNNAGYLVVLLFPCSKFSFFLILEIPFINTQHDQTLFCLHWKLCAYICDVFILFLFLSLFFYSYFVFFWYLFFSTFWRDMSSTACTIKTKKEIIQIQNTSNNIWTCGIFLVIPHHTSYVQSHCLFIHFFIQKKTPAD